MWRLVLVNLFLSLLLIEVHCKIVTVQKWPLNNINCYGQPSETVFVYENDCLFDVPGGYSIQLSCLTLSTTLPTTVLVNFCTGNSTCQGNCTTLVGTSGLCVNQTNFSSTLNCNSTILSPSLLFLIFITCIFLSRNF